MPKALYRIQNWSTYEKALVQRGSITFWLSDDFAKVWCPVGAKQRGAQFVYSDQAISILLTVKEVLHLSNREVEGYMRSLFKLPKIHLTVPDHSTLSKQGKPLKVKLPKKVLGRLDIVMDSTGMKIYGECEWKVRTNGKSKRRTWRRLHVGVDPDSGEFQAAALIEKRISDDAMAETLFQQIEYPIERFAADGSYDKRRVYASLHNHSPDAQVLIPPRKNARIWQHGNTHAERVKRDENLRFIRQQGRTMWKRESGYHVRSLAETAMFRMKTIFGDHLYHAFADNADHSSYDSVCRAQSNDALGHAAKLSSCLNHPLPGVNTRIFLDSCTKAHQNCTSQRGVEQCP